MLVDSASLRIIRSGQSERYMATERRVKVPRSRCVTSWDRPRPPIGVATLTHRSKLVDCTELHLTFNVFQFPQHFEGQNKSQMKCVDLIRPAFNGAAVFKLFATRPQ